MQACWLFDTLAVTVERTDFLDPEFASEPDIRERGVRVEVRPFETRHRGSIYASDQMTLQPALCRIDLLESAPRAADRMHWHPTMDAGEPGDRVFDAAIPADPLGWLAQRLANVTALLTASGVDDVTRHSGSAQDIASHVDDIVAAARSGLEWARGPWPEVLHNERGMAVVT
jgi:hypothetical protein